MRKLKTSQVIIPYEVLVKIMRLGLKSRFVETGGPIVGFVDRDGSLVMHDVMGPGPKGIRERCTVLVDGQAATRFCNKWNDKSRGKIGYIGDWHTHVSFTLKPSEKDVSAMKVMNEYASWTGCPPISLILSTITAHHRVYMLLKGKLVLSPTFVR